MGAENSNLRNLSISDKQLIEKLSYDVMLYEGKLNQQKITIFEDLANLNLFTNYTLDRPLARSIKKLKVYRHPFSILKFLAATNDKILITEPLEGSLARVLKNQNEIQICLGIKNILNALIFLVESANVRHLNVCMESIFVTSEGGAWKLSGFEHLFKNTDISNELLKKSRPFRNKLSIDPQESDGSGLEQYAFAILCEAVISKSSKIPYSSEFLSYCETHLKHKNPSMRPLLSAVLLHNFFNHDFIVIHSFLSELALKSQQAKVDFFKTLVEKLKQFDENSVGSQLSDLLLSRLVLLEQSAQIYLLPTLLKPQTILEDDEETSSEEFIFTTPKFIKYIVPRLKKVFCVLDVQIRLILLEHFHLYVNTFTKEELVDEILPQLLLGIKDTNDLLVTKTLLCLADLVSILGANCVIGKNRTKIFADGRPQQTNEIWTNDQPRSITPVMNSSVDILSSSPIDHVDVSDHSSKEKVINQNGVVGNNNDNGGGGGDDSTDNEAGSEWNWEEEEMKDDNLNDAVEMLPLENLEIVEEKLQISLNPTLFKEKPAITTRPKIDDNIDDLDIKNKKLTKIQDQAEDFFSDFDMTPTFQKSTSLNAETLESPAAAADIKSNDTGAISSSSRLQMSMIALADTGNEIENENEGWGDDDDNWNNDDDEL